MQLLLRYVCQVSLANDVATFAASVAIPAEAIRPARTATMESTRAFACPVCRGFVPFGYTAMGKNPLYPFDIPQPVARKLAFVHKGIRETARAAAAGH
jgi:hypothetical protein